MPTRYICTGPVKRLVTAKSVVGEPMACQELPKLVVPSAWYRTPVVPFQRRTAVPPFTVRRRFEARSVTAWTGPALSAHNNVKSSVEPYLLLRLTRQNSLKPFDFRLKAIDSSFECESAENDL